MAIKIPVPPGLIITKSRLSAAEKANATKKANAKKAKRIKKDIADRGRSARRKGHNFEREIANMFKAVYPHARRMIEYQEGKGVDIAGVGIYDPQLKRSAKSVPMSAIKEVPIVEGRVPLLISKVDLEPVYVTLQIEHFLDLLKQNKGMTNVEDSADNNYKKNI